MKCSVCGLPENDNPAHTDDYDGPGKHSFKSAVAVKGYGEEILVAQGGTLKSLGDDGSFEALGIVFEGSDLGGDIFTKSTEIFHEVGDSFPLFYDHGLDATLKRRKLGTATISKIDDAGVWIKGQLKRRDDYEKAIYTDMVKPGKAGISSGAASHLVSRKKAVKGTQHIEEWGLAEFSITPEPFEPRTFVEVKSLARYYEEDFDDSHDFLKSVWEAKGGAGSGNFGHAGRSGERGGSSSEGGGGKDELTREQNESKHQAKNPYSDDSPNHAAYAAREHDNSLRTATEARQYVSLLKEKGVSKENAITGTFNVHPNIQGAVGRDEVASVINKYWDKDNKNKKAIPGSTLGTPNKQHKFEAEEDDEDTCSICGKAEDDPKHDMAAVVTRPMKSLYEEKLAERVPSVWEYRSALDDVVADIAAAKVTEHISGVVIDTKEKITEAVTEYAARVIPLMATQVDEWAEERSSGTNRNTISSSPYGENRFYLRSLPHDYHSSLQQFVTLKSQPVTGETLDQHSARAVSAVEELVQLTTGAFEGLKSWARRVRDKIEFRRNDPSTKSGRTISAATHTKLQAAHQSVGNAVTALSEIHSHIGDLMEIAKRKPGEPGNATEPDADGDEAKSLSYEEIQLILTQATTNTELVLSGETL